MLIQTGHLPFITLQKNLLNNEIWPFNIDKVFQELLFQEDTDQDKKNHERR
jgi:hypothetical protein